MTPLDILRSRRRDSVPDGANQAHEIDEVDELSPQAAPTAVVISIKDRRRRPDCAICGATLFPGSAWRCPPCVDRLTRERDEHQNNPLNE